MWIRRKERREKGSHQLPNTCHWLWMCVWQIIPKSVNRQWYSAVYEVISEKVKKINEAHCSGEVQKSSLFLFPFLSFMATPYITHLHTLYQRKVLCPHEWTGQQKGERSLWCNITHIVCLHHFAPKAQLKQNRGWLFTRLFVRFTTKSGHCALLLCVLWLYA